MYKTQKYNGLSLLLLERQITLHSLWCNKLVVMLGLTRSKNSRKLGSEDVNKVGSKTGSKTFV